METEEGRMVLVLRGFTERSFGATVLDGNNSKELMLVQSGATTTNLSFRVDHL